MKPLLPWAVLAILLAITPVAWAAPTSYVLDVQGMKCAFCAYKAVEKLSEVPGVSPPSVHIDLPTQKARLTSDTSLARDTLADALERAGFRLLDMKTVSGQGQSAVEWQTVMHLKITASDMDERRLGPVLKTLGAAIAEHGGRVHLKAPAAMDKQLVKLLLMGKQVAVPVHFETSPAPDGVAIEWQRPSDK